MLILRNSSGCLTCFIKLGYNTQRKKYTHPYFFACFHLNELTILKKKTIRIDCYISVIGIYPLTKVIKINAEGYFTYTKLSFNVICIVDSNADINNAIYFHKVTNLLPGVVIISKT